MADDLRCETCSHWRASVDGVFGDVPWLIAEVERMRKNLTAHESLVVLCRDVTSQMDGLMRALRDAVADVDEVVDE